MGGGQVMKRIPRIKFPQRHATSSPIATGSTSQGQSSETRLNSRTSSEVPAPPKNTAVGGKASLQPKRTPVTDREIEAIMLGGCI